MKETSDKELKITEERVKAAAEKCGTAKEILKELFPDVFKVAPPKWEDVTERVYYDKSVDSDDAILICVDKPGSSRDLVILTKDGNWHFDFENNLKFERGRVWQKSEA